MIKVGRYTAALLLVAVGGVLLTDQLKGTHHMAAIWHWWPVLLITLGIEYVVVGLIQRNPERRIRLDVGGLVFSLIVAALVFGVVQGPAAAGAWMNKLHLDLGIFNRNGDGPKVDKGVTPIPVTGSTKRLVIDDPNGMIHITSGDVQQIEAHAIVVVPKDKAGQAEKIADNAKLEVTGTDTITVKATGDAFSVFGSKLQTRIDLELTLPRDLHVDLDVQSKIGSVQLKDVDVQEKVRVETNVGSVEASDIGGALEAHSIDGSIEATEIRGDIQLETTNGSIEAEQISGVADLHTVNGSIEVSRVDDACKIETTNGSVEASGITGDLTAASTMGSVKLEELGGNVHAETTVGSLEASSHQLAGDWSLQATVGNVSASLPKDGDFHVQAHTSLGHIKAEFGFEPQKHDLQATNGNGTYLVKLESNGNLEISEAD